MPGGTTTTAGDQSATTTATGPGDQLGGLGGPGGGAGSGEETVTATGVHVVFTQPVNQSGVPAQFVEHILGEVYVDSLAVPAPPVPSLDFSAGSSSACGGGHGTGATSGGSSGLSAGGSSTGGAGSSGSLASGGSAFGSTSQPASGATGTSLPAAFAAALRKPLWLLVAYLVWQALVLGTGWSLWNWRKGEAS